MSHKIILAAASWIMLLIGCSYQVIEPEKTILLSAEPQKAIIRTGEVREFSVAEAPAGSRHTEFVWTADKGNIIDRNENVIRFQAPESTGVITLSCQQFDRRKVVATYHFVLTAYRQVVVLKADDLVYASGTIFPQQWNQYFALLDSLGVKGSAGIIGNSLENAPQAYYNRIKMFHQQGNIEFWNHGYTHGLNMHNHNGELCHEFFNRDFIDQQKHLNRTQELGRSKLGITFKAFGAPANSFDQTTTTLIDESMDIRIWFYGHPASEKSILKRSARCEIEYPTHKPDFNKFLANYTPDEEHLTLQFHPSSWSEQQFNDFRKVILFLYRQGALFMTPTEFAYAFHPQLMEPGLAL